MVTELSSPVRGAHSLSLRSLSLLAWWKNKINRQYFLWSFLSSLHSSFLSFFISLQWVLFLPVLQGPHFLENNKAWRKKNLDFIQSNNSTFSLVSSLTQVAVLTWSHSNFLFPICSQCLVPNLPSPLTFTPWSILGSQPPDSSDCHLPDPLPGVYCSVLQFFTPIVWARWAWEYYANFKKQKLGNTALHFIIWFARLQFKKLKKKLSSYGEYKQLFYSRFVGVQILNLYSYSISLVKQ